MIPDGSSLSIMHEIFLQIKSSKFQNISLFYSIDRTWNRMNYRGDFTVLFILHLTEEAEIMMNNLILYFVHEFGEEALLYFTNEEKKDAKDDNWDMETKRVVCITDEYLEKKVEDNISLGEAQVYIEVYQKEVKKVAAARPELAAEAKLAEA